MQDRSGNFLSPAEVRELASMSGVTIGSHGATHTPLTALDDRALREELVKSKSALENIIGRAVDAISYPHGAVDRRVREAAAAAGYTIGACSRFDINSPGRDPLLLCRTDIHACDTLRIFKQKLHGDWDWYKWRDRDPAL
jgi:peptidoglycan/xylan/chitin deacetylase (PgdA/CDA1 family)